MPCDESTYIKKARLWYQQICFLFFFYFGCFNLYSMIAQLNRNNIKKSNSIKNVINSNSKKWYDLICRVGVIHFLCFFIYHFVSIRDEFWFYISCSLVFLLLVLALSFLLLPNDWHWGKSIHNRPATLSLFVFLLTTYKCISFWCFHNCSRIYNIYIYIPKLRCSTFTDVVVVLVVANLLHCNVRTAANMPELNGGIRFLFFFVSQSVNLAMWNIQQINIMICFTVYRFRCINCLLLGTKRRACCNSWCMVLCITLLD